MDWEGKTPCHSLLCRWLKSNASARQVRQCVAKIDNSRVSQPGGDLGTQIDKKLVLNASLKADLCENTIWRNQMQKINK